MEPTASDGGLVARARTGDQVAIELLVQRHQARALRLAVGLLRDRERAEDATQEAFLRALAGIGRMRQGVSFGTWLYQCVVWAARDESRRQRRWLRPIALDLAPAGEFDAVDLRLDTLALLERIPLRYREVLLLKFYAGMTEPEISSTLGCRVGTVKSRTSRGLAQFERARAAALARIAPTAGSAGGLGHASRPD